MSAENVKPTALMSKKATADPGDGATITLPVDESGRVRVWLRHNVLGGRAGQWWMIDARHPDLPRLLELDAIALPDPVTGELLAPLPKRRGGCGCR